ncbi:MAG: hypothetical protein JST09_01710 [Bacteroidetes bacterium]|nr:hypothetical protein [Bacteroidota bacterium]
MKINGRLIVFTIILIVLATACKFLFGPSLAWSGFSPVIAIALFAGFIMKQKDISFLFPLLALLISDVVIQALYENNLFPYAGFYSGQWKNYLVLLATTLIGLALKGRSRLSLLAGALIAPTFFYLLSNLNVWASQEILYPKNFSGLLQCYAAGIPFYRNSLIATIVFLPVILIAYNYIMRNKPVLTVA